MPPRVNVNLGTGSSKPSNAPKSGKKRPRDEDQDDEEDEEDNIIMEEVTNAQEVDDAPEEEDQDQEEERGARNQVRRDGKQRRIESLGHKKVSKEFYKKDQDRKKLGNKGQWSR